MVDEISDADKKLIDELKKKSVNTSDLLTDPLKQSKIDQAKEASILLTVFFSAAYMLLLVIMALYGAFVGFPLNSLHWYALFGIVAMTLFCAVVVFMFRLSGDFGKAGLLLALKKGDLFVKFTKSRKFQISVQQPAPLNYFKKGDDLSRYIITENGYMEPSTKAMVHTVREDSFTDFDVNKEFKIEIEDIGRKFNTLLKQEFYAGAKWIAANQDRLLLMVMICMLLSLVGAGAGIGFGYYNNKAIEGLDQNFNSMKANQTELLKIVKEIQEKQLEENDKLPDGVVRK